jgi:hypothetical protein
LQSTLAQQTVRALAYRGWSSSLHKRDLRLRAQAAMLREQGAALRAAVARSGGTMTVWR